MGLFSALTKTGDNGKPEALANPIAPTQSPALGLDRTEDQSKARRTGRTSVYAVRVRESFKGEMLALQAELQLERHELKDKPRRITEGEIIELMLESLKANRRDGGTSGNAVPLTNDVWQGVHEIARRLQCAPAQVVEQLVVQKIAELELLPRRR